MQGPPPPASLIQNVQTRLNIIATTVLRIPLNGFTSPHHLNKNSKNFQDKREN